MTRLTSETSEISKTSETPEAKEQEQSQTTPHHTPRSRLVIPILIGSIAVGIGLVVWYQQTHSIPSGILKLSGRIEGYETDIGAKVAGRVDYVAVREGDRVRKGQVIVQLDDSEVQAQLRSAEARLATSRQQEEQARLQISVAEAQVTEAELNLKQSEGDAKGRIDQAAANVASVEAQLNQAVAQVVQAKSELSLAKINRDRLVRLTKEGASTQQQLDQAQSTLETAQANLNARAATVESFRRQVSASQGGLVQAESNSLNPDIRTARLASSRKQLVVAQSQLAAAQSDVNRVEADKQQILAQIAYLKVLSPIDGVVTARSVEPGAVVTTGKTLLTVINPDTVYLRGYIPAGEATKVRVGQVAQVFLDSPQIPPFSAKVTAIDTQASFTPENIYFKEDRVKQVFGIKIGIDNPGGLAKPGLPADGEITLESGAK